MKRTSSFLSQSQRGFSFGETLLATFVLSVGLLSVVKLFQVSVSQSILIRDATIASELAQEGVELARNVRDNNFAAGGNGFATFSSNRHCFIAVNDPELNCYGSQGSTSEYTLAYQNGRYESTTGSGKFRRYLYIDYSSSDTTALIRSFVTWDGVPLPPSSGSVSDCSIKNKCVYTETFLTNWKS